MSDGKSMHELLHTLVRGDRRLGALLSSDDLDEVLSQGVLRTAARGTTVPPPGGEASIYLVLQGALELRDATGASPSSLEPGDLIGAADILSRRAGGRHVVVSGSSMLVEIPLAVSGAVLDRNPRLLQRFFEKHRQPVIEGTLAAVPALASLDGTSLAALCERASLAGFPPGSEIVREGEPGDHLHVIADGIAGVRHTLDGAAINLALLEAGDYFGEWALLTGAPRAATVTAITRAVTVSIDRETFLDLVQQHPAVRDSVDLVARNRFDQSTELRWRVESVEDVEDKLTAIARAVEST